MRAQAVTVARVEHESGDIDMRRAAAGRLLVSTLRSAVAIADASLTALDAPAARREGVRNARRALKEVRALAPLCRSARDDAAIDGVLEFAAKANQLLGPLRDRDALTRTIQRIADRFADTASKRLVRTVLLATLVFGESDRRDDDAYTGVSLERARRSLRSARASTARLGDGSGFDRVHALRMLQRVFRACRGELDAALCAGDLARLHECRKQATFLALALRPFEDEVPGPVRRLRARAKRLAAALGEDRDFALLEVEMSAARAQIAGSPLAAAIDDALRLARLESAARVESAARDFLRLGGGRVRRGLAELLGAE